jgi:hypothetical protein
MTLKDIIEAFPALGQIPDAIKRAFEAAVKEMRERAASLPEPQRSEVLNRADAWEALVNGASPADVAANTWAELRAAWASRSAPIAPDPSDGQ